MQDRRILFILQDALSYLPVPPLRNSLSSGSTDVQKQQGSFQTTKHHESQRINTITHPIIHPNDDLPQQSSFPHGASKRHLKNGVSPSRTKTERCTTNLLSKHTMQLFFDIPLFPFRSLLTLFQISLSRNTCSPADSNKLIELSNRWCPLPTRPPTTLPPTGGLVF